MYIYLCANRSHECDAHINWNYTKQINIMHSK